MGWGEVRHAHPHQGFHGELLRGGEKVRSNGRHRGLWGSTQRGRAVMAWAGLGCCEHSGPVLPGAVPATGFLRQSGISLDSRGFIPVNKVRPLGQVGKLPVGLGEDPFGVPVTHDPAPPTDDADQHSRRVCSRRRRHLPSGLEKQPQSEHPPLADGSRPGYRQPGGSRGWEAVPGPWPPPRPAPQLPLGPAPWGRHSRLCSGLSGQPHAGDGASSLPPPSLDPPSILWAPGSAGHRVSPHCPCTSLSFPVVLGHHISQKSSQIRAVTWGGGV